MDNEKPERIVVKGNEGWAKGIVIEKNGGWSNGKLKIIDQSQALATAQAEADALRAEVERLREATDRIQKRRKEWREALANWTGVLSMSRKEAEAAALEMDWASFIIDAAIGSEQP